MTDRNLGLANTVRPLVVAKYLGQLLLALFVLSLPPLLVAALFGDLRFGVRVAALMAFCLLCFSFSRRIPKPSKVQTNEALVVVALAFVITALLMTYPLMSAGLSPLDAFFESVSGVTTTGLTPVTSLAQRPATFLFTRAWMQWYGGLGIAVFSVALMADHHIAARRLIEPADGGEGLMTSARFHARQVLLVYLLITAVGLIVVWLTIGDGFIALVHVLAAVSTGGFSPYDNSLAGIADQGGRLAVTGVCLVGAMPLPLFYYLWRMGRAQFGRDLELNAYVMMAATVTGLLFLFFYPGGDDWARALENALIMGISAQSTTGFSSMAFQGLPPPAQLVLIFSMYIGACVGSTGGGVKVLRVLIGLRQLSHTLLLTALPSRAVAEPKIRDRTLHDDESIRAMLVLMLFIGVIVLSWLIFVACGYPPLAALYEVCSATATTGLSSGITRAELEPGLKLLLCIDMLLGRVEIIALLVVCYPRTWFGRRESS